MRLLGAVLGVAEGWRCRGARWSKEDEASEEKLEFRWTGVGRRSALPASWLSILERCFWRW